MLQAASHAATARKCTKRTKTPMKALVKTEQDFYKGKIAAAQFFFNRELPKVAAQFNLLASLDRTTLDMQDAWF
ncbi:acyl-CoA dehydrogenase C-terminal domain-containing protein [Paraburkholderia atlantica]|uniref:acyl-CoA dehydrogenase C-terminal domain-containing protein n=1 Tax=Paraburkholderia atlantica TaxID=2654982 RepID=UPI003D19152E